MEQILAFFFLKGNELHRKKTGGKANLPVFFIEKTLYPLFFLTILSVDSFDLLTNQLYLVFQLLNLAVHLVDE